jgi:hypothetical protein
VRSFDYILIGTAVAAVAFGGLFSSNAFGVAASSSCNKKKCRDANSSNSYVCSSSNGTGSCPSVTIVTQNRHCTDGGAWDDCQETTNPREIHSTTTTWGSVTQTTTWKAVCTRADGSQATFTASTQPELQAAISAGGFNSASCTITNDTTCNCSNPTTTNQSGVTQC